MADDKGGELNQCGVWPDMPARSSTQSVDQMIASLARRQHGVVATWQLRDRGVSRHQIATRAASGRLTSLHRGVFLAGSVAAQHSAAMAALLAYRLEATLSHRSAAALWGLLPYPAAAPAWVIVRPERYARRPHIHATRARLEQGDVRMRFGMRVTSPPRTILDLAALIDDTYELERIAAEAAYRGLASETELRDQLQRNPRKRGAAKLRVVVDLPGGPRRTRSAAERAMLQLLRENGIAGFETNARVLGYEVDFLWRSRSFAVEVDGWDAHSSRKAFEDDRLRAARLQAHGIAVMRVTGRQIVRDPKGVIARLVAALDGRHPRAGAYGSIRPRRIA
jgi:very-short-patch-repair endonuclease